MIHNPQQLVKELFALKRDIYLNKIIFIVIVIDQFKNVFK